MSSARALSLVARLTCALAGLLVLPGCDRDDETSLKQRVDRWVSVGATTYFESRYGCTAAVYALRATGLKSTLTRVSTVDEGLRALSQDKAVAFDIDGQSPTQISERIATSSLPEGIGVIGAGVSAAECMSDEVQASYVRALNTTDAVLIFDTTDNALAIADFSGKSFYFAGSRN